MSQFSLHFIRCWRPACAVLWFLFFQVICGLGISALSAMMGFSTLSGVLITIFASLLSSLFTIIALTGLNYVQLDDLKSRLPVSMLLLLVVLLLLASVGINVLEEMCEIPDNLEDLMMGIMSNPLGVLSVAVIGPVAEELTFRGGLMGGLMRNGYSARTAIIASALVFGIIHANPVQIVFAGIVGLLLGWAYWRTGSLLPSILMHVANNSFSVLMYYISENPQGRITDEIGLAPALALMVISLIAAYYLYKWINARLA